MSPAPFSSRNLSPHYDDTLEGELYQAWDRIYETGEIAYDPQEAFSFQFRAFKYHYIPGRGTRPGAKVKLSPIGLKRPYEPCPFDDVKVLEIREVLRLTRENRTYHLIANKFPVKKLHLLLVRNPSEDPSTLPQLIFGPEEIEDALLLARMLGQNFRFFFNSNSGKDGSSSGSTVNHWHFQILPHDGGAFEKFFHTWNGSTPKLETQSQLPDWDIPHFFYHGSDLKQLATSIWPHVEKATEADCAYNLEIAVGPDQEHTTVALFPRAPLPPITIPGFGEFSNRYGGWELSGDVVIYDQDVFDWVQENPEEADALAWRRLRDGTRELK